MRKYIYGFVLMAMMVLGLAACTPAEELAPVLTITSEQEVVIGVDDSYTLVYTVDENTQSVTVTVSEVDGGTSGVYNESTKVFTASEGGVYTLTVVATNIEKTATDSVTITVNDELPVISFEEGALDEYEVNQGENLTLPSATAKDALDVDLTITVTVDSDDASVTLVEGSYIFTSNVAGDYVVSYSADDAYNQNVTETIDIFVAPTSDPVISYQDGKLDVYETSVGTELTLPSATALDGVGADVALEVYPTQQRGVTFEQNEDDTFSFIADVAGTHVISYYAEDQYGNYVEEFIEVEVSPATAETELTNDASHIENLATSGLLYQENFSDGYNSDLAKGLVWDGIVKLYIDGGANAISGNSLIFDYSDATATTNTQIFFGALDSYIQSGRWEISFDVKIIEGNAPNFYVSFIFEGDNSGDNLAYALTPGETTHISYNYIKSFDSTKTWYLRLFTYTGDTSFDYDGLKLALDNFELKWTEVVDPTVQRTGTPVALTQEMLDGEGYTLTGTEENFTSLSGSGVPTWVNINQLVEGDILTPEQAALLTSENGFNSDYAIRASTQQVYLDSLRGLLTDPDYIYTVTYKVYSPTTDSWYFWIAKEDTSQAFAQGMPGEAGLKEFTHSLFGDPQYYHVGLYSGGIQELLIGDITISRELYVPSTTTPNGNEIGDTWQETSFLQEVVAASSVDIGDGVLLNTVSGFEGDVMALVDSSDTTDKNVVAFNGSTIFETVGTYTVTLNLYVVSLSGGPLMVNLDNQVFDALTIDGTGAIQVEYEITGRTVNFFSLYTQGGTLAEVYLSAVNIELSSIPVTTPNGNEIGDTWQETSFLQEVVAASSVDIGDGVLLNTVSGFEGDVMALVDSSDTTDKNVVAFNGSTIFETVGTYTVTLNLYVVSLSGGPLMVNLDNQVFDALTIDGTGAIQVEYEITGRTVNFFSLYTQGGTLAEVYLSAVDVELTAIN